MRLYIRLAMAGFVLLIILAFRLAQGSRVTFSPANMSIDVGKDWKFLKFQMGSSSCTPYLVGRAGMIDAVMLDPEITDIKESANNLQTIYNTSGKPVLDSFKQENFTTASGLAGIHLSYKSQTSEGENGNRISHDFITHNMRGNCVSISYVTSQRFESPEVVEAIQKTLRVE